ncbi:MAG: thiamine diphosphokinase [Firmicutes bacterium]|nr:thiamine diphosphokinase [Bacillota bacterium]
MLLLQADNLLADTVDEQTAVVVLGGARPQAAWLAAYLKSASHLAAADAGAAAVLAAGRVPHLLVGDFDSLTEPLLTECRSAGAEIITLPAAKDLTDGEFLLDLLVGRGLRRLLVLGALGGRTDHLLANIGCAEKLARQGVCVMLAHDTELLVPFCALDEPRTLQLGGFAGRTLSLISLAEESRLVQLKGFAYPLQSALRRQQSLGISNIVQTNNAQITLTDGSLLVCLNL